MNLLFLLKSKNTVDFLYDDNTLRKGLEIMRSNSYSAIPVLTRNGEYVGSISEGDFLNHILDHGISKKNDKSVRIRDILSPGRNPAVQVSVSFDELLERIATQNYVPVVDDRNVFIGIITRGDIIDYLRRDRLEAIQPASQLA